MMRRIINDNDNNIDNDIEDDDIQDEIQDNEGKDEVKINDIEEDEDEDIIVEDEVEYYIEKEEIDEIEDENIDEEDENYGILRIMRGTIISRKMRRKKFRIINIENNEINDEIINKNIEEKENINNNNI